jgi:hypothetical protein
MPLTLTLKSSLSKWFSDPKNAKAVEAMTEQQHKMYQEDEIVVLPSIFNNAVTTSRCNLGGDVLADLEMFNSYRNDETATLFSSIDKSILKGTQVFLKNVIQNPISNIESINRRQELIKSVDPSVLSPLLTEIKDFEQDLCWLFADKEEHIKSLEDMLYFRLWFLKPLNSLPWALTSVNIYKILVSPMLGILSPILYFVIPYYIIKLRYKINISFTNYIRMMFTTSKILFEHGSGWTTRLRYVSYIFSMIFYFQGIFNSLEISRTIFSLNKFVLSRVDNILAFFCKSDEILKIAYCPDIAQVFFDAPTSLPYQSLGVEPISNNQFWLTTNFGKRLSFLKTIDATSAKTIVNQIYMVDMLNSAARLHCDYGFGFCKAVASKIPTIKIGRAWHPSINDALVVRNDIHLSAKKNAILTGPNAGGKSTLVKSILLSVLLAQTFGVVNAEDLSFTPFEFINSQISIPDCKGKESLFEAEMHRCKFNLEHIRSMPSGYSFVIMDEIFNSTNPIEGIAGAYAIAKTLGSLKSTIVMFTTHYNYLTKLQRDTKRFVNYKMDVMRTLNGFEFPYELTAGVSKQYIALDLLRSKGFTDEIVDEALRIKNKLTRV